MPVTGTAHTAAAQTGKAVHMATDHPSLADIHPHEDGHHHRDVSGGWLRPAVFGAMDGLVTNVSLICRRRRRRRLKRTPSC